MKILAHTFLFALFVVAVPNSTLAAPPVNDDFAGAIPVSEPLPFGSDFSSIDATTEADDPSCVSLTAGEGNAQTIWYSYTPSADGWVSVFVDGDFDPTLGVYTGPTHDALEQIACVDQGIAPEKANFFAEAGTTYYIMVASFFATPGGNGSITVDVGTAPANIDFVVDPVGRVAPKSGTVQVNATLSADREVFVEVVLLEVLQKSGRGAIIGSDFKFIFQPAESLDIAAAIQAYPFFGAKGFVAGPATVRGSFVVDDGSGGRIVEFETEIVLKGGLK